MTQSQSQVKVLNIHEFAELCRTTSRTIRFYDKAGLLKPVKVDSWTKYRYYKPYQTRDFYKIKLLQGFRVPLREMGQAVKKYNEISFLDTKLDLVKKEIEEKGKELKFLKNIKEFLFTDQVKKSLKQETHGPFILFCLYDEKGRFDRINADIYKLMALAKQYKISCLDKQVVTYFDSPAEYQPKDAKLEIGLVCQKNPGKISLPPNTYFRNFPKQNALTYKYLGPFEYLTFIHQRLYELTNPKSKVGKPFDIHFSGPWNKKSEYDFVTKVGYPTEK